MRIWLFIIFLIPFNSLSQKKVSQENFDEDELNKYILQEVNRLRKRNRSDSLIHDTSLDDASIDHVKYMSQNDDLSHQQPYKLKYTPFDRVKLYGGSHSKVAENIQMVPLEYEIEKSKGRLTYRKLAKEIVGNWKKSKGHYQNMVNPDYKGVSHQYAIKDGKLYICQVLASPPFKEQHDFEKGEKLFVKNKKPCWNCNRFRKKADKDQTYLGWYEVSNDSIYYRNTNVLQDYKGKIKKGNLRKLFNAKGKVAVDVIHHSQYSCSGSPSYHNSLYYDGYYLGYVDKSSLDNDLDPNPATIKIFVGMKPAFVDTFYQVDFNLIKRKKPCMHGMTIYVVPDYFKPKEYFSIPKPKLRDEKIIITDSIEVRIPFETGQTDEDTSIFQSLIKQLVDLEEKEFEIKSIYFSGVASIEGTKEGNQLLFQRRGEIVKSYLKKYYPDYELQSEFYENFADFRAGIVTMDVPNAVNMSEDSLRLYANLNRGKKEVNELLDETRYSSVRIIYEDALPIKESGYGLSVTRLIDLMNESEYRDMIPLYEYLANSIIEGDRTKKDSLLNLQIPEKSGFEKLHWYDFVYRLTINDNFKVTADVLNDLKEVGAISSDADYLEYRLLFNVFYGSEQIDVSDFEDVLPEVRRKRQKAWIECLEMIQGVQNFKYTQQEVVADLVRTTLKKKFDVRKTYFICQYLIKWGYTKEPYILLSKFAKRPGQFAKLYKQYIKLAYFLGQFDIKKEWKRIRIVLQRFAKDYPNEFCELFKWDQMGVRSLEKKEIAELFCEYCRSESN